MHGKRDEESGAAGGTPRVCGCARRTCLIITAAIVGAVLLAAIALGVGLGVGLKSSNGPGPSPSPVQSPSPVAQPVAPAATPVVPSPSSAATSEAPDPATQTGGTTLDCQPCSSDAECLSGTCGNTYDGSLGYSTCATSDSIPCMLVVRILQSYMTLQQCADGTHSSAASGPLAPNPALCGRLLDGALLTAAACHANGRHDTNSRTEERLGLELSRPKRYRLKTQLSMLRRR